MPAGMRQKRNVKLTNRRFGIGSHSLRAWYCLPRENSVKYPGRSMEFIGFYILKCHYGDRVRLKHYAAILVIEF